MQILYLMGNGFDLNLNIRTSYKDFYEFYQSVKSNHELIAKLKLDISNNYKNWSDLELALGQYTSELKSVDEFDIIYEDIGEQLAIYLNEQERKFDLEKVNNSLLEECLSEPENSLFLADRNRIREFKKQFYSHHWVVNIITFNYTTVLDNIVARFRNNPKIGKHPNSTATITIGEIIHIHGYTDNRMIMGVNDISQIGNSHFHNDQDILEAIVKSECNRGYRHTLDDSFKKHIQRANLICIFGCSIGDTDNIWWELIGEKLKQGIVLIIFSKGEEVIDLRIGYKNNRTERRMRNYFLKKTKLSKEEIKKVENNIYIVLNSSKFEEILIQ